MDVLVSSFKHCDSAPDAWKQLSSAWQEAGAVRHPQSLSTHRTGKNSVIKMTSLIFEYVSFDTQYSNAGAGCLLVSSSLLCMQEKS